MTITEYLEQANDREAKMARAVGCDRGHLNNIKAGRAKASPQLALRIEAYTSGQVTKEELRPDIYPGTPAGKPIAMSGEGFAA